VAFVLRWSVPGAQMPQHVPLLACGCRGSAASLCTLTLVCLRVPLSASQKERQLQEGRRLMQDMKALIATQAKEAEGAVTTLSLSSSSEKEALAAKLQDAETSRMSPPSAEPFHEPFPSLGQPQIAISFAPSLVEDQTACTRAGAAALGSPQAVVLLPGAAALGYVLGGQPLLGAAVAMHPPALLACSCECTPPCPPCLQLRMHPPRPPRLQSANAPRSSLPAVASARGCSGSGLGAGRAAHKERAAGGKHRPAHAAGGGEELQHRCPGRGAAGASGEVQQLEGALEGSRAAVAEQGRTLARAQEELAAQAAALAEAERVRSSLETQHAQELASLESRVEELQGQLVQAETARGAQERELAEKVQALASAQDAMAALQAQLEEKVQALASADAHWRTSGPRVAAQVERTRAAQASGRKRGPCGGAGGGRGGAAAAAGQAPARGAGPGAARGAE